MKVIDINTRRAHVGPIRRRMSIMSTRAKVLPFPASDFRLTSEFVYKTSPLSIGSPAGACVVHTHLARKPFRRVVARTPVIADWIGVSKIYIEKLECGHEITTFSDFYWDENSHLVNFEPTAKRRGCEECRVALAVPSPERKAA